MERRNFTLEVGITLLIVSIVCIIIGTMAKKNGGTDVLCPKCKSRVHIPGDGAYTCPNCKHEFVYGNNDKIRVTCPYCKNDIFVDGAGIHTCPKCDNDFSYLQHTGVPVKCPNCFKFVFVSGPGKIRCGKCNVDFNYVEPNNNINKSEQFNKDNKRYYDVLGCSCNDSEDEITRKYKEMAMKFHPDRITAKDLPEEFLKFSTDKFIKIQEAYEKIKSSKIKMSQLTSDEESKYFSDWSFIKDGVKIQKYIVVKYFGGHSIIDKHGDFYNKDFYFYVNVHNVLLMLTVSFVNKEVMWALRNQELEYYTLSPDKTMTIISTLEGKRRETIYLSPSAYAVMLKSYPKKDIEYIKTNKSEIDVMDYVNR